MHPSDLRPIPGASRYFIARDGSVFRRSRDQIPTPVAHGTPGGRPPRVQLILDDGRKSSRAVAQLVAAVWGA